MVLSYYVIKYPYKLVWNVLNLVKKREEIVFYCANELDLEIFKPVGKHLKEIPVVVKNRKVKKKLKEMGIESRILPVFPKGVLMCRQACYLFPEDKIVRVGITHGAYHFKPFASAKSHNMFDQYFMSSSTEVKEAEEFGITSAVGVGYPKLDAAFDGTYDDGRLDRLREKLDLDPEKKTILFSATWDGSQMSAVDRWYDKLGDLTSAYNVLVTLHVWTSDVYREKIKATPGVKFVEGQDVVPYIMLADICVGDTSSILSEMCAMHKPIVTFETPVVKKTVPEVREIIKNISFQINTYEELEKTLEYAYNNSHLKFEQREKANFRMFDQLDGNAGQRVAGKILEVLPELKLN